MSLIISKYKKSPVRPGEYKGKILSIHEKKIDTIHGEKDAICFEFLVDNEDMFVPIKTYVFVSNYSKSEFAKFKNRIMENYGVDELNLEEHVNTSVLVKFDVKNVGQDEYPVLIGYSPYMEGPFDENDDALKDESFVFQNEENDDYIKEIDHNDQ